MSHPCTKLHQHFAGLEVSDVKFYQLRCSLKHQKVSLECWTALCFLNATLLPITKKSPFFSSDESDEEEDHRKKFKIKIKPLLADRVVAAPTVDELKASIGNISLSPSPVVSHPDITALTLPAFISSHLCLLFPSFKSVGRFITTFQDLWCFVLSTQVVLSVFGWWGVIFCVFVAVVAICNSLVPLVTTHMCHHSRNQLTLPK